MTKTHKKQKLYTETPEFPSLPFNKTFEDVKDFAVESQEALMAVETTFVTNSFISLPLISPHQPQYRFIIENDNSISLIIRNSYHELKKEIDSFDPEEFCGINLKGPVGVGKSYLLYLLAAEYRMNRQNYRVTYINNCAAWGRDKLGYILREFIITFYDDTIDGKSIVDWCQTVTGSEKEEHMMMMLIESLVKYVKTNNLQWIVIFDQHNAFNASSVKVTKFPFNIIDTLSDYRAQNITVIISTSANNDTYPIKMKGWYTHEISSHRFDEDEFKVWCDHYELQNIGKVKHDSEEAVDALFWTGGVPFELYSLWNESGENLSAKTENYRVNQLISMRANHGNFYDKLSEEKKLNLIECICRMALGLSPPVGLAGMDRQLFDIVKNVNGERIITALTPVARDALLGYHGEDLINSLEIVTEIVLSDCRYTNDTKSNIIAKYITTRLELFKRFKLKSKNIIKRGRKHDKQTVGINDIVHFGGNKLPSEISFSIGNCTLFVPKSPNYPGLDFFIWDPIQTTIMGFQVTVKNPFPSHSKSNNYKLWVELFSKKLKGKKMHIYWIIPKSCEGNQKKDASLPADFVESIILLEDIYEDFPALKKLKLQVKEN